MVILSRLSKERRKEFSLFCSVAQTNLEESKSKQTYFTSWEIYNYIFYTMSDFVMQVDVSIMKLVLTN